MDVGVSENFIDNLYDQLALLICSSPLLSSYSFPLNSTPLLLFSTFLLLPPHTTNLFSYYSLSPLLLLFLFPFPFLLLLCFSPFLQLPLPYSPSLLSSSSLLIPLLFFSHTTLFSSPTIIPLPLSFPPTPLHLSFPPTSTPLILFSPFLLSPLISSYNSSSSPTTTPLPLSFPPTPAPLLSSYSHAPFLLLPGSYVSFPPTPLLLSFHPLLFSHFFTRQILLQKYSIQLIQEKFEKIF
ncbi:unnamed protein product [Meloidogyne enterolobii]|uniref:Uncharacterized protein n=1 Tax=Meloidogyne enterolobii TaxID=390850 RepID=A0ACB0Y7A0_MELEN